MKNEKSRRSFVVSGIKAGFTLPFIGASLFACNPEAKNQSAKEKEGRKKLNILILGGTSFLGPHQIAYALGRGHKISTFTRGKTKPTVHQELFAQVEQLVGDRASDLSALENKKWDAVIDNSGRNTEWTKRSAELLKDHVGIYLYTSSTGVFYPYLKGDIKEDRKLNLIEPAGIEDEDLKLEYWYGVMKSSSEMAARNIFGSNRTIIVRPTYMIGPADKSDRFIYWPIRLSRGGKTMVPGKAGDPIQYADVRDVGEWMIRLIEENNAGTFNAAGPKVAQDMYGFIEEARTTFDVKSEFVKIDDYDFLLKHKIPNLVPWIMPTENNLASALVNNEKAYANGFTTRPLVDSVRDIHEWWNSDAVSPDKRTAYEQNPESVLMREKSIIEAWEKL